MAYDSWNNQLITLLVIIITSFVKTVLLAFVVIREIEIFQNNYMSADDYNCYLPVIGRPTYMSLRMQVCVLCDIKLYDRPIVGEELFPKKE